jgi:arginase
MDICAIIVPYDSGLYRARMGRGPERHFESGLKPLVERLGYGLTVEEIKVDDAHTAEIATTFELCRRVAMRVRHSLEANVFPLVLSGNCDIAIGAISGCGTESTGVVWFDAHGEATTPETTETGFLDGMGISILTGQCWGKLAQRIPNFSPVPGNRVLLIGSRHVQPEEIELLSRTGVRRAARAEDWQHKIESISREVDGVYVHVDLDVLDPEEAVANQWTSPNGLTVGMLTEGVREIKRHARVKGFGIGSYDPACDRNGDALRAACAVAESIFEVDD